MKLEEKKKPVNLERLCQAIIISHAIDALVDMECPSCQRILDPPSLDSIKTWLEEGGK